MSDLLLVSHGSRDPRAQAVTRRLAAAVARAIGGSLVAAAVTSESDDGGRAGPVDGSRRDEGVRVGLGYLELAEPSVPVALDALRRPVVVQPLLFVPAFHATDDLPRQLAGRDGVVVAPVLAPDPLLLDALDRRLVEALDADVGAGDGVGSGQGRSGTGSGAGDGAGSGDTDADADGTPPPHPSVIMQEPTSAGGRRARLDRDAAGAPDGLVLVSAGTSFAAARALHDEVAASWSARHDVPALAAYASTDPGVDAQIRSLRGQGCARIAVGALFVAPGRLLTTAREEALGGGAAAVAEPFADAPELVELLVQRYRAAASPA